MNSYPVARCPYHGFGPHREVCSICHGPIEQVQMFMADEVEDVADFALEGLGIDGDFHKQWFLEEIVDRINGEGSVESARARTDDKAPYLGEPGIPP